MRQKLNHNLSKKSIILSLAALVLIVSAGMGFCAADTVQQAGQALPQTQVTFYSAAIKFLKAMAGVAISSFIIYAGLTIYNKFFVKTPLDGNSEEDVLKTPHSTDEALTFFIKKNKIK